MLVVKTEARGYHSKQDFWDGDIRTFEKWDEGVFNKLIYIYVSHSTYGIDSLQFVYRNESGKIVTSPRHGGIGENFEMVEIKSPITKISGVYGGWAGEKTISNLKIEGSDYCHGVFAPCSDGIPFSVSVPGGSASIKGFHGHSDDDYLRAIGVYIVANVDAAESSHAEEIPLILVLKSEK